MAIATTNPQRFPGRRPGAPRRKMGTWKMAYADFLTALMAFFLLLWLVSGVSPASRAVIADYFTGGSTSAAATAPLVDIRPSETQRLITHLATSPTLQAAGDSVRIAPTADGLRIDLVDSAAHPLFDSNSGALNDAGAEITRQVAALLAPLSASLTIEGHTDAFSPPDSARSNWDISSERANSALRVLVSAGVSPDRVTAVTGLAATRPLNPGEPHLSANRRTSILLHIDG